MPLGKNNRGKLLFLVRYLQENSDQEHPVSLDQIISYLDENGISAERKSLYSDFEFLRANGFDIKCVRANRKTGYYLGSRNFELSELKLLVDAVQSSKFITEDKSFGLIERLEKLASRYQANQLRRQVWVRGRVKSMNESIFSNVDKINLAIGSNCQILFQYFTWNTKKEQILRRNGARYAVSPWALLLDNENYYLLAYENGMLKHFRVDKMLEIRVTDWPREGKEAFDVLNMAAYTDSHFGMFSGERTSVKLLFDNSFAGIAIDQFGTDVLLIPKDDEHFTVTVNIAVNIQFYGWLASLGDKVQILAPQSAVDGMRNHLQSLLSLYPSTDTTAASPSDHPLASLLAVYSTILFVDTETTGFDSRTDHITEFAAIKVTMEGEKEYSTLVQLPSDFSIPEDVVAITGITPEMCATGITPAALHDKIHELVGNSSAAVLPDSSRKTLLVSYNAQFDASFLCLCVIKKQ